MNRNRSRCAGGVFCLETIVAVISHPDHCWPCGMLLNEWLKLLVHRHRPFVDGPFGYSLASGHTIGATLLYGQLLLFLLPLLKRRHLRIVCVFGAASLVSLVGSVALPSVPTF